MHCAAQQRANALHQLGSFNSTSKHIIKLQLVLCAAIHDSTQSYTSMQTVWPLLLLLLNLLFVFYCELIFADLVAELLTRQQHLRRPHQSCMVICCFELYDDVIFSAMKFW